MDKVSVYFNPSSFVGIMGPSGSGKTTLLDIITGRRELSDRQKSKVRDKLNIYLFTKYIGMLW